MATGRSTKLTGATGEFLVSAQLCRRGLIATPFAGNVPHYDIIASSEHGGHLAIQVKAINKTSWQFNVSNFADIRMDGDKQIIGKRKKEPYPNLFCIFVSLGNNHTEDRYFIFSWNDLAEIITNNHRRYLEKHKGVRPKSPKSTHSSVDISSLEKFEDNWDLVLSAISNQAI